MTQPDTRTGAQLRADQVRTFQAELARLEAEGVLALDAAQRASLRVHHESLLTQLATRFDIDRDAGARQLSLGMRIASFLGALALAASVFFLFYQFWGRLSTPVQVVLLVAAPLAALAATWAIHRRDATGYFSKLAALVAFACFVLNLVMLGQIFNITPSDKALVPWAALALLLAYTLDLRLLLAAGILCIIGFVSARTGTWSGLYWLSFGTRPENFLPVAVAMFFVPSLVDQSRYAGFAAVYRIFGMVAFFVPVLVLANWGDSSYLRAPRGVIEGGYQLLGFAASAVMAWHGARRAQPETVNTAVTFFVLFLYTKLFDWWWEIMPKWLFFLVVGLAAVLLLVVFRRIRQRMKPGAAP